MTESYEIKVYIAGMTATARHALANLEKLRARLPGDTKMEVQVIDVLDHPELAEQDKVLATPMVVKRKPEPVRRLVGDLSGEQESIIGLDLPIQ